MPTLDFPSKDTVYGHHLTVPYHPIEVVKSKSVGNGDLDNNLIINADNLYALKALLPRYGGKVNCIYIDPPYNTGNGEWVYNDNVDSPKMREWLKNQNPVDGEDQERHDKWCCMMWPRLQLLKELLADDGVIFISIDDNEQANLKLIMDEIFGEENFVANITWRKKAGGGQDSEYLAREHDYILCYRKSSQFSMIFRTTKILESDFRQTKNRRKCKFVKLEKWGSNALRSDRRTMFYPIKDPDGKDFYPTAPNGEEGNWRKCPTNLDDDHIHWKKKEGRWVPSEVIYFDEAGEEKIVKERTIFYDISTTTQATKEQKNIFGKKVFDNSKPVDLINRLLNLGAKKNAIVLDSFAGSGTTAQAVLELNKEDGGNRKFILVQMNEEKKENGKWVTERIADEITAERVRRIIKGIPNAKDENLKRGLGGEFTFCTLGEELSEDGILIGEKIPSFATLAKHLFYSATGTSLPSGNHKNGFEWFIGERDNRHFYLIYKPDKKFLAATESALNQDLVERIIKHKTPQKRAIVYSTSKFIKQKELSGADITWCQLPFCLYGSPIPRVSKTPIEKEVAKK